MKNRKGFTLIELMIAVAIVGILASIAYPAYQNYVVSSRRADLMGELQLAATAMERYFTINGNYSGATAGDATATIRNRHPTTGTKFYDVTLTLFPNNNPRTGFTITATPTTGTAQAGDGVVDISHTGVKRWDENNDGFGATDNNWVKH